MFECLLKGTHIFDIVFMMENVLKQSLTREDKRYFTF